MKIVIDEFLTNPVAAREALIKIANGLLNDGWPNYRDIPIRGGDDGLIGYIDASDHDLSPVLDND